MKQPEPNSSAQMRAQPLMDRETADEVIGGRALAGIDAIRQGEVVSGIAIAAIVAGGVVGDKMEVRTAVQINGDPETLIAALAQARRSIEQTCRAAGHGDLIERLLPKEVGPEPASPPDPGRHAEMLRRIDRADMTPAPAAPAPALQPAELIAFLESLADDLDEGGIMDRANDCRRWAARVRKGAVR